MADSPLSPASPGPTGPHALLREVAGAFRQFWQGYWQAPPGH